MINFYLSTLLSESAISQFPNVTHSDVERTVSIFFKNARDRDGGRMERKQRAEKQREARNRSDVGLKRPLQIFSDSD